MTVCNNWTVVYANDFEGRIDDTNKNHLDIDAKKELRDTSINLSTAVGPAEQDSSTFEIQVNDDFKMILTSKKKSFRI